MRHDDEHEDQKDDEQDETVGYKRPPRRTRFQKGKSGNPHGRPKGTLNLKTVLTQAMQEPVVITEHGRQTTITKYEAMMKQLVNKAVLGDPRATAQVVPLVQEMERHEDGHEAATPLSEPDERVKARLLRRLTRQAQQQGGAPHGSDADAD